MSEQYQDTETYGSHTLYGVMVAGAAFLVVASMVSFSPAPVESVAKHVAQSPTSIETIVVTPGQTTR